MNRDVPQLGISIATRTVLILWGLVGATGAVWAAFYLERLDSGFFVLLILAVVAPVLGLSYYSYHLHLQTLDKVTKHASAMGDLFNSTLSTLALAIDAKDRHTHGHPRRVEKYANAIAESMELDQEQVKAVAAAALLHDIGKLAIPEYILNKRGVLTPEEVRKMRMHPQFGADIISNIKFPYPVAESILSHHERFDGQGYPRGLQGKNIPLGGRVVAVADSFDAYLSDRIESKETLEGAIRVLREGSGTAFDPDVVRVWEKIYGDVVVWPSNTESDPHTGIQQAKSELKMLESLTQAITGLTTVQDIFFTLRNCIMKCIPDCSVAVERGEREGVPVVFGSKTIATILAHRPEPGLTEDELRLLHAVAATVAPMLSNALTIEEVRREATLDKLTGLPNRRAFEMMANMDSRQHFSIVLIDVNCFKSVNDNFGHNAGDATLIRIADHLRAAFHDAQLTCRLGGDEFLVVSFAGVQSLRSQIRRFRHMVAGDPAHEAYRMLLFGVACGLASIPADGLSIEQAIQRADERMYAIKTRFKQHCSRAIAAYELRNQQGPGDVSDGPFALKGM